MVDGDIAYTIAATASSADPNYNGKSASVSVTNTDVEGTAPVVSANPVNQSITHGANASFTAAASGTPSLAVQWQVSTDGGSNFSNISDGGVYSGATTATLSLTRPPVSYSGYQYRAVFANGISPDAVSTAATLTVTPLGITGSFTADDKVYDGTTAADVSGRSLTGVLSDDDVSLSGGTAAFADKNVGTDKAVTLTGAVLAGIDAGNYSLNSVTDATADITIRAITVTAVTDTKVYDGTTSSDGIPEITSTLRLADGDKAKWTQTYDTKDAGANKTLTPAGTVDDGNGGANYSVAFVPVSTGVIEKATLTVTAEDKSSQYSDPRLPFTAAYSGFVNGETLGTSGVTGTPSYTTSPKDLDNPITQPPGDYAIIPGQGTLAANNYDFDFEPGTYTVTEEDAAINFDSKNPVSVKVISDGGKNSAFTWKVVISQDNDGNPGDLSLIKPSDITLAFSAVGSGGGWSGKATAFDAGTGVATFRVPENKLGVETYSATVSFNNACFTPAETEDILVIYDPSLGFTTGGGWFIWPAGTANPRLEGAKTNFGYTMKYNKKGNNVQGSFLLIAHLPGGGILRMKSNAINGLAIINNKYPGEASFSGKCVYTRVDADGNILAESGNQTFTVYARDMNEPGRGTDMFWFATGLTIAGENPFSLDSDGDSKVGGDEYVLLGGGNIAVPHTANSGDSSDDVGGDAGGDTSGNTGGNTGGNGGANHPGKGKKK